MQIRKRNSVIYQAPLRAVKQSRLPKLPTYTPAISAAPGIYQPHLTWGSGHYYIRHMNSGIVCPLVAWTGGNDDRRILPYHNDRNVLVVGTVRFMYIRFLCSFSRKLSVSRRCPVKNRKCCQAETELRQKIMVTFFSKYCQDSGLLSQEFIYLPKWLFPVTQRRP